MTGDRSFGEAAVQAGFITAAQLEESLRTQGDRPLRQVLTEKKWLREDQGDAVEELLRTRPDPGTGSPALPPHDVTRTTTEDHEVGKIALEWMLITEEQLGEAFRHREDARQKGREVSLGEILAERGWISMEDLLRLVRERARRIEGVPELPRYQLGERLGEGATAIVYRAWDKELERSVAIKVLRDSAALSDLARQRFRREAQTAAGLAHPNLVSLHDAGESNGRLYLIMELVEGRSLGGVLSKEKPTLRERVLWLEKVARGVASAHARGVVHRDLKPANILFTKSGEPKVADFGLAHLMESPLDLTRTGSTLGTPLYMSPEQIQGRSRDISPRTDVYALGAILYECLTGRAPHEGETTVELYSRIVREAPPRPRSVNPEISPDLEGILRRALDKNPARRYAHAEELASDLRRYLDGVPIFFRSAPLRDRLWELLRSRRFGWAAAGLLVVILGAALAYSRRAPRVLASPGPVKGSDLGRESPAPLPIPTRNPAAPSPAPVEGPREGLVGYFRLDERSGETASDVSGHGKAGALVGEARWGSGEGSEWGLELDGHGSFVDIPASAELETLIQESYTLSAWFRPSDVPPGKEGKYGIITKTGSLLGLVYNSDERFMFQHFTEGWKWGGTGSWTSSFPPGEWHHVAGVLEKPSGAARIYVDGACQKEETWTPGGPEVPTNRGTWKIGANAQDDPACKWFARGRIAEVRLYNRALPKSEIELLYKVGLRRDKRP
jgi:tRNA A-37 threonylcarbamoyl transferase component Bud32